MVFEGFSLLSISSLGPQLAVAPGLRGGGEVVPQSSTESLNGDGHPLKSIEIHLWAWHDGGASNQVVS